MAGSGIEHYLFDIVQSDSVNTMAKLAALSVLKSMIEKDSKLQDKCLEKECVTVLMAALETGLEENDDPSHIVYISVAMEIIFILSQRPICSIQTLVTEEVIRMFLEYVNPSGQFYMFPNNLKQVLADLCEKKHMIGKVKVVTMATEPIEYIHRHTKNKFKRFQCIPDKLKVCDVYNTEGETDVCITDHLIHNHRAWPGQMFGSMDGLAILKQVLDEYFEDSDIEEDFTSSLEHAGSQSGGDLKYVLGQRMRIEDDDTHELYSSKKAKDIKREELAKHVCGMLNRENLKIQFYLFEHVFSCFNRTEQNIDLNFVSFKMFRIIVKHSVKINNVYKGS
ncbi:hypothetical protein MAR_008478 [Mya arenaria]|uniref:Interferon-related developmental regulator N-terminal domain-containing protein n=1 Tax=Mya arenaria TaxID=6604 RepID=A0ABY7DWT4_MYAAR|nr:hypothetical protein MAR_008478 [Mya arenaria]